MIERKIYKPRCSDCEFHMCYSETIPKKVKGAFLKYGCRYCTGGKRIREFKRSDPKVYVPSWCPRIKQPAVLRIYCFKDENVRFLQLMLRSDGIEHGPYEFEYALRYEGHANLTASVFLEMTEQQTPSDILGMKLHGKEVVEIDDGIVPYCFYLVEPFIVRSIYFNGEKARKNRLEDSQDEKES